MKRILLLLFGLTVAAGCGSAPERAVNSGDIAPSPMPTATPTPTNSPNQTGKSNHEHVAPHGGTLVAFGDEFAHLEIVLDLATGQITAYALDGEADKSVQIAQENIVVEIEKPVRVSLTLEAVDSALTGEKRGATSEFRGQGDGLKNLSEFDGKITAITIRGRLFKDVEFNFPKGNESRHVH